MENFGLGILLSFRDEASNPAAKLLGILHDLQGALEALNNAGSHQEWLTSLGNAMIATGAVTGGFGMAISKGFTNVISTAIDKGKLFESQLGSLTQLYGNAEVAAERYRAIATMAATTPFGSEQIMPAAIRLRTLGIEFDKTFKVMKDGKEVTRDIMSLMGDLAAIRPDKSLEDVSREVLELAEGNARPLKMSFGIDIKETLGEDLAKTAEGRIEQFARVIGKKGYAGMLDTLNDSWGSVVANLDDWLDFLWKDIVDVGDKSNGLYAKIKEPLKNIGDLLKNVFGDGDDAAKNTKILGKAISEGLQIIMAPALKVFDIITQLGAAFVQFSISHPQILKMGIAIAGLGGQLLVLAGAAIGFSGVIIRVRAALTAWAGAMGIIPKILTVVRTGIGMTVRSVFPLIAAVGLLYLAFNKNIFGIRTLVEGAFTWISDFVSILTDALTHVDVDKMQFSLSKKNANLAREMGIMDLIHWVVVAEHYVVKFIRAFKQGFNEATQFVERVGNAIGKFFDSFRNTPLEGVANNVREITETWVNSGFEKSVESIGASLGRFSMLIASVATGFKLFSVVKSVGGWFSPFVTAISTVTHILTGGWSTAIINSVRHLGLLKTALDALKILGGAVFTPMGVALLALGAIIMLVATHWDYFLNTVQVVWNKISPMIQEAIERISPLIEKIGENIMKLFDTLKNAAGLLIGVLANLPVVGTIIQTLWDAINGDGAAAESIINELAFAFEVAFTSIISAVEMAVTIISGALDLITIALTGLVDFLTAIFEGRFSDAFDIAGDTVKKLFDSVDETMDNIFGVLDEYLDNMRKVFEMDDISGFNIVSIFNEIVFAAKVAWAAIQTVRDVITDIVGGALTLLKDAFSGAFDFIKAIIEGRFGDAFDIVGNTLEKMRGDAKEWIERLGTDIDKGIQKFKQLFNIDDASFLAKAINEVEFAVKVLWTTLTGASDILSDVFGGIATIIKNDLQGTIDFVVAILEGRWGDAWNIAKETVSKNIDEIVNRFKSIGKTIDEYVEKFKNLFNFGKDTPTPDVPTPEMPQAPDTNSWFSGFSMPSFDFSLPDFSGVISTVSEIGTKIGEAFTNAKTAIGEVFSNIGDEIGNAISQVREKATEIVTDLENTFSSIKDKLIPVGEYISVAFEIAFQTVRALFWNFVADVINPFVEQISVKFEEVKSTVQDKLSGIFDGLVEAFAPVNQAFDTVSTKVQDVTVDIEVQLIIWAQKFIDWGSNVVSVITNAFTQVGQVIGFLVLSALELITSMATSIFNTIVSVVGQISDFIGSAVDSVRAWVVEILTALFNEAVDIFNQLSAMVTEIFNTIVSTIQELMSSIADYVMNTVITPISEGMNSLIGVAQSVFGAVQSAATSAFNAMASVANSVLGGIKSLLSSIGDGISNIMNKLPSLDSLKAKLSDITLSADNAAARAAAVKVQANAEGGIYSKGAFLTTFAEESAEAAIPLVDNQRNRDLWWRAGEIGGWLGGIKQALAEKVPDLEAMFSPTINNVTQPQEKNIAVNVNVPDISIPEQTVKPVPVTVESETPIVETPAPIVNPPEIQEILNPTFRPEISAGEFNPDFNPNIAVEQPTIQNDITPPEIATSQEVNVENSVPEVQVPQVPAPIVDNEVVSEIPQDILTIFTSTLDSFTGKIESFVTALNSMDFSSNYAQKEGVDENFSHIDTPTLNIAAPVMPTPVIRNEYTAPQREVSAGNNRQQTQSMGDINFQAGAIQIVMPSGGNVDAKALARQLMPEIRREIELEKMKYRGGAR